MVIADRLKALREAKHLSQLDIQQRTGLLRCYISRVENGHTVPEIETLEKFAGALEVPMYQLFHEGEIEASVRKLKHPPDREPFGTRGAEADYLSKLRQVMSKLKRNDQKLILHMAQKVAKRD
jgi:transcriptional regulator with XRE-family HTH domain